MIAKEQIKKWNDEFKSLSKPEKRVAIAKDVIAQIKKGKYTPTTGNYIDFHYSTFDDISIYESIQKNFDSVKCEVCAIGSMFLSTVKFTNKCKFNDYNILNSGENQAEKLRNYFPKKDIILMEYVFELFDTYWDDLDKQVSSGAFSGSKTTKEEIERIKRAQEKFYHSDEKERLLKMMRHLIRNKGEFVI